MLEPKAPCESELRGIDLLKHKSDGPARTRIHDGAWFTDQFTRDSLQDRVGKLCSCASSWGSDETSQFRSKMDSLGTGISIAGRSNTKSTSVKWNDSIITVINIGKAQPVQRIVKRR